MSRAVRSVLAVSLAFLAPGCSPRERTFDAERAFHHLAAQVDMGPRTPGSEGHRKALEYFRMHFEATAERVDVHRFEGVAPIDSSSAVFETVVAIFNAESDRRYLFGAHWDTRIFADQEEDPELRRQPVPGANDGASGVAVLLEVATALAAASPRVGVDIVLFDGEDQGIEGDPETYALGSQRFVRDQAVGRGGYTPVAVFILDMVGRQGGTIPREGNSVLRAAPWVELVWSVGADLGIAVLADSLGPAVMDDHVPFLRAGIPAVDLIGFDDPDWHTTRDLPENCSPETLGEVGRLVLALIARLEDTP